MKDGSSDLEAIELLNTFRPAGMSIGPMDGSAAGGKVVYGRFMSWLRGPLAGVRKAAVLEAFQLIDVAGGGVITMTDALEYKKHLPTGSGSDYNTLVNHLSSRCLSLCLP
jgi:hypothetical protein